MPEPATLCHFAPPRPMPGDRRPTPRRMLAAAAGALVALTAAGAAAQPAPESRPNPEDLLGNLVVVAGATRPLPKIAVVPSLDINMEDVTLRSVVRRDLDLCGEFELLSDEAAPKQATLSDGTVDVKAWAAKGAEALVKVSARALASGQVELRGLAYFTSHGDAPVFDKTYLVDAAVVREESHRLADALIGALTGQAGGFASQMAFVYGTAKQRRAFVIDSDGHDAHPVSRDDEVVLSPAFGPAHRIFYAASVDRDEYKIYTTGKIPEPVEPNQGGSVYGLAFSPARDRVVVSVAVEDTIKLFAGPDFLHLTPASPVPLAMQPTFTPSGKIAYVGAGKWSQRVFVEGKAISPDGLSASSPTFCRHPDGVRAIFAVGVGKDTDLVATGELGGGLARLTQGQGRNNYPACSPDGRLVAFFSTRTSGQGPGLYVMRVDGGRPKRISTLLGDSLVWSRLPERTASQP